MISGLLRQSLIEEHQSEVLVRVDELRIERDRPGEVPRRLIELAERAVGNPAVGVDRSGRCAARERRLDQGYGLAVAAALIRDEPGEMQRRLVPRHVAQQLPVHGLGGVQLTLVVQADRAFELLIVIFLSHRGLCVASRPCARL